RFLISYYCSPRFSSIHGAHRDLHSFPTRRSSDLEGLQKPTRMDYITYLIGVFAYNRLEELDDLQKDELIEWYNNVKFTNMSNSRSEEHTSELQSRFDLVCRLLLEKKKKKKNNKAN